MIFEGLTICETALIDSRTNLISYINVIDEINPQGLPITIPRLTVAVRFIKEDDDQVDDNKCNLIIRLNEKEIVNKQLIIDFFGKQKNRLLLEMPNFPISVSGELKVEIKQNNRTKLKTIVPITTPPKPKVKEEHV